MPHSHALAAHRHTASPELDAAAYFAAAYFAAAYSAAAHLEAAGYTVLGAAVPTVHGALPIVATCNDVLVFSSLRVTGEAEAFTPPLGADNPDARYELRRQAAAWLSQTKARRKPETSLRWDAIGVRLAADGRPVSLDHVQSVR